MTTFPSMPQGSAGATTGSRVSANSWQLADLVELVLPSSRELLLQGVSQNFGCVAQAVPKHTHMHTNISKCVSSSMCVLVVCGENRYILDDLIQFGVQQFN